jgi:hypothetical protein
MTTDDFDFAAWAAANDSDLDEVAAKPATEKEKHPCGECAGSGRWLHGTNRRGENKCFACQGRGFFLSSAQDRRKSRDQRRESKSRKLADAKDSFSETHSELIVALSAMTEWNNFAQSLVDQFNRRGDLSEKQIAAAQRIIDKTEATRAANAKSRDEAATEIDLSAIRTMFDTAFKNGRKRPTYRAEGIVISRAPDSGRNAGALYIKTAGDDYQGKITPEMIFKPTHSAAPETTAALTAIAADPQDAAVRYGRETGSCGCCGRELTDPTSIAAGIGPVCEANWF